MAVDRAWLEQNLGGERTSAHAALAPAAAPADPDTLARERIDFDSQSVAAEQIRAGWPAPPPTLKSMVAIPWPEALEPRPAEAVPAGDSLPEADVLIVTWTSDEGRALSHVLSPGYESHLPTEDSPAEAGMSYWKPYTKNFDAISAHMSKECPAVRSGRLGTYWTTQIGKQQVTLFKSESHFSQDGAKELATTPNRLVWKQIIEDCKPKLVITTGTGGGIGEEMQVGDVVVSRYVTYDPGGAAPQLEDFACAQEPSTARLAQASKLFAANEKFLPNTNTHHPPLIVHSAARAEGVVTTRGFQYDDTANTFHLKGLGDVCEMGDAVLGYVCQQLGDAAPNYAMVRNASDPEIDSNEADAGALANYIYEHFGRWSSVCSAIVCWSIVAAL
jgi:hypothetical protein